MNKPWKVALVFCAIFAAGGITGSLVTLRVGRHLIQRLRPPERRAPQQPRRPVEEWGQRQLRRYTDELKLTAEQQAKIKTLMQSTQEEVRKERQSSITQITDAMDRLHAQITQVLTPDQRTGFEKIRKEDQERRRRWMMERSGRGERPPERGPGLEGRPPPPPSPEGGPSKT